MGTSIDDLIGAANKNADQGGVTKMATDTAAPLSTVQGYTPAKTTMGTDDSVESRVGNLIKDDSELMQLGKTQGMQTAANSGLLNTSMAAKSAQLGILEKAIPIASQDANTAASYKLGNTNAVNTANSFNSSQLNAANSQLNANSSQLTAIGAQGKSNLDIEKARATNDLNKQVLTGAQEEKLTKIKGDYEMLSKTSTSVAEEGKYFNAALSQIMATDLPADVKDSQITKLITQHENNLLLIGKLGNVDLSNVTGGSSATPTEAAPKLDANGRPVLSDINNAIRSANVDENGNYDQKTALMQMWRAASAAGKTMKQVAAENNMTVAQVQANLDIIGKQLPTG